MFMDSSIGRDTLHTVDRAYCQPEERTAFSIAVAATPCSELGHTWHTPSRPRTRRVQLNLQSQLSIMGMETPRQLPAVQEHGRLPSPDSTLQAARLAFPIFA